MASTHLACRPQELVSSVNAPDVPFVTCVNNFFCPNAHPSFVKFLNVFSFILTGYLRVQVKFNVPPLRPLILMMAAETTELMTINNQNVVHMSYRDMARPPASLK